MVINKCNSCGVSPKELELVPDRHYIICPICGKETQKSIGTYEETRKLLVEEWNSMNQ